MIVECPDCGSSYRIQDEKIPSSGGRVTCPSCEFVFVVWPGGETAEMTSAESADRSESSSNNEESTAVADADEIRRQAERSVPEHERSEGSGESIRKKNPLHDEHQQGHRQQKPTPSGQNPDSSSPAQQPAADAAPPSSESAGAEESSPQSGGIPDFLEDAMEGTEQEGTVEMENPFLDDDGSMSVPDEFQQGGANEEDQSDVPEPQPSVPEGASAPSSPESEGLDAPNDGGAVAGEEQSETSNQHGDETTREISDPSSLVDEDVELDELFGESPASDSDASDEELTGEPTDPQATVEQDVRDDLREETEHSGSGEAQESSEVPETEQLESGDVPPGVREPSSPETGPDPSESQPTQASGGRDDRGESDGATDTEEEELSGLLVAIFVVLLAIFLFLLAGALGLVDVRGYLPGVETGETAQPTSRPAQTSTVVEGANGVSIEPGSMSDQVEPMVRAGVGSLQDNRLNDALRHFRTAQMTAPESSQVHRLLSRTYQRLQRPDKASQHRLRAMRLDVSDKSMAGPQSAR